VKPIGTPGTNTVNLEVSTLPPLNLDKRLNYLIQYPYGCVEQVTSSVFPQLVLGRLTDLSPVRKKEVEGNLKAGIHRLKGFQLASGGMSYWPGSTGLESDWGTSYSGHFLIEAKNLGYSIPADFMPRWVLFQREKARQWVPSEGRAEQLMQAYRLYTLALSRNSEFGAMNRLRERKNLSPSARWVLASAYALAGRKETALQLTDGLPLFIEPYSEYEYTYGSDLRDEAFILSTLTQTGQMDKAYPLMKKVCGRLGSPEWYSTQSTAMAVLAVAGYSGHSKSGQALQFSYRLGNGPVQKVNQNGNLAMISLPVSSLASLPLEVKNLSGNALLFTRVSLRGQPAQGDNSSRNSQVGLKIRYLDMKGKEIPVGRLEQGTEFMAEVSVSHLGSLREAFGQMALSQVFPAGWEIRNTRMEGGVLPRNAAIPDYQDIRDDRVNTFFSLRYKETQTYYVLLNAAYIGQYFLPSVKAEAMYNGDVFARAGGFQVQVVPRKPRS
jgi:uncharacterized protein YfaS (alpha-2-macroglobulin family)